MKQILLAILATVSSLCMNAEVLDWNIWDGTKLRIDVPTDGTITFCNPSLLEINWEDMALVVRLYEKTDVDEGQVKMNLYRKANGFNMFHTAEGKLKVKGYDAYTLEGTLPDGSRALLCDMVSKKRNLVISITVNYLFGNRETAEDIIKSFGDGVTKDKPKKKQKIQSKEKAIEQQKELRKQQELEKLRREGELHET